ncbi:filamentous hemagglutinin N-terminal domain-containing protein [Desmonostoc muscorum LEGE 12446]|uniref:Filamentous hemagglutinin N-terminal domain-containing protein n=1 Tax=Desmonostoc muscorum LEGE 12446 TaxID=1828758 RepID=A0A8J7A3Q7_DESMC|nr:filamentous hemagglutinin N-terminal domain-containing protein [Desmonostoc muscorum]MCF2151975.1 filamentous hemagglutinin N-terminal domain-containing protein [Desmonostoc muscorum LEGE 12446]
MKKTNIFLVFCQQLAFIFYVLFSSSVMAQIVPDNTLSVNSLVTSQSNTNNINGGTQVGRNLFHSFEEFSLSTGDTAYFNNASNVQNIISRVTGLSISNIDGLLKANGNANLFLINPNGIIFGPNATLNIGGSFLASTANRINFADGSQFSAKSPQNQPLLTVSAPLGLGFDGNPGAIQAQGTGHNLSLNSPFSPFIRSISSDGLRVKPEKTLALVGGDIALEGGKLEASGGRIELGSVDKGIVSINTDSAAWTFNYKDALSFKNIQLSQQSIADVSGSGSGFIQAQGADVELASGSIFLIQNQGNKLSGDIIVNASEELRIIGTSLNGVIPTSLVNETLLGNGGRIEISTPNLIIEDGAAIVAKTYGAGRGGDIIVNASEFTKVTGGSASVLQLPSNITTGTFGSGDGGNLTLSTKSLSIQDGGEILTSAFGTGKGGNLTVNTPLSTQVIGYLSGNSQLSSTILTRTSGSGNAGNLFLSTGFLIAKDGGIIGSLTLGNGSGGEVTVNSNNSIELIGLVPNVFTPSSLVTATYSSGNSGKLTVNTKKLTVRDGGIINTSTRSTGKADSLIINASDSIDVIGRVPGAVNPSLINSSVVGSNKSFQELYLLPSVLRGDSGSITINTKKLNITDGALISVRNDGPGNAGTLQINADQINITNNGGITATTAVGEGGDIGITSKIIQLRSGNISATAGTQGTKGNGGNIRIDTDILTALNNSAITANAYQGRGGNIRINTKGLFISPDTQITASSQRGIDGTLEVNFQNRNPSLTKVQPQTIPEAPQIASVCQGHSDGVASSFVNAGTGGVPAKPQDPLRSNSTWQRNSAWLESIDNSKQGSSLVNEEPTRIVEAQGWILNANGNVVLTAEANPISPYAQVFASKCQEQHSTAQISSVTEIRRN